MSLHGPECCFGGGFEGLGVERSARCACEGCAAAGLRAARSTSGARRVVLTSPRGVVGVGRCGGWQVSHISLYVLPDQPVTPFLNGFFVFWDT